MFYLEEEIRKSKSNNLEHTAIGEGFFLYISLAQIEMSRNIEILSLKY